MMSMVLGDQENVNVAHQTEMISLYYKPFAELTCSAAWSMFLASGKDNRMDDHQVFYEEVGRRIRDARKKRKPALTQDELGKLVGLTRTSITNLEQGRQKCLLHTLFEIAAALHVEPAALIPSSKGQLGDLDRALKHRAPEEKEWIMSAVKAATLARDNHGA